MSENAKKKGKIKGSDSGVHALSPPADLALLALPAPGEASADKKAMPRVGQLKKSKKNDGTVAKGTINQVQFQKEASNGRGYEVRPEGRCRKCMIPRHSENECPFYIGKPTQMTCRNCHLEAYHSPDACIFKRYLTRKKVEEGPPANKTAAKN